jgi:hypothetical protein
MDSWMVTGILCSSLVSGRGGEFEPPKLSEIERHSAGAR